MKRLLLFAALILSLAAKAADEVYLFADPVTIEAGGEATLQLYCETGTKTCIAFQAYFTLPQGISVKYAYDEDEEEDLPQFLKGTRLKSAHGISPNFDDGMWKVGVGSQSNSTFKADKTNPVMLIVLVADQNLTAGNYNIKLSNVEIVDEDGMTPYDPADRNLAITVTNSAAEANTFKTNNAAILAKTVDTVTIDDKTAVDNALADYNLLSDAAKAKLTDEKDLLDSLKEKVDEIATGITSAVEYNGNIKKYDLSGKTISGKTKGMVIVNGKKIVQK